MIDLFREVSSSPKWCDTPPWYLVSHRHICAIPHFATYCAVIVRYPTKTSTKELCDTIAASTPRYEKHRYWASKHPGNNWRSNGIELLDSLRTVEKQGESVHPPEIVELWRPAWATRPEIPEKMKSPQSSSKVGFGGILKVGQKSGIPKPVVWGTYGLHPGFPWFSSFSWFPWFPPIQHSTPCL